MLSPGNFNYRAGGSVSSLRDIYGSDLEVFELLVRRELASAGVLAAGPQRGGAAVAVADVEVVEVDRVGAGFAAVEDDAVLAERTGRGAGQADDAVLPDALAIGDARAGRLIAPELVNAVAAFEERAEGFGIVAFEGREPRVARGRARREGDVVFDPVGGVLRAAPVRQGDGEAIARLSLVGDGHGDSEDFALRRGGRVILGRRGLVAERGAEGTGPGVHLGGE